MSQIGHNPFVPLASSSREAKSPAAEPLKTILLD